MNENRSDDMNEITEANYITDTACNTSESMTEYYY